MSNEMTAATYSELMEDLTEALQTENRFAAGNVIREMASRRGITKQEMVRRLRAGQTR